MSVADHFDHIPDRAFVRDYDSNAARRQFKVSLMLLVVLAIAITALDYLVRFDSPAAPGNFGQTGTPPVYAGKL